MEYLFYYKFNVRQFHWANLLQVSIINFTVCENSRKKRKLNNNK